MNELYKSNQKNMNFTSLKLYTEKKIYETY